jgi:hypothetical protein
VLALTQEKARIARAGQVEAAGIELLVSSSEKTALSAEGGAKSGALPDAEATKSASPPADEGLAALATALLGLSPPDRAKLAVMLLQQTAVEGGGQR